MASYRVYVCQNRDCKDRGGREVWTAFEREINRRGLNDKAELIVAGCQGRCGWGPNVTVHPGATKYCGVDAEGAQRIVARHLEDDEVVEELRFKEF